MRQKNYKLTNDLKHILTTASETAKKENISRITAKLLLTTIMDRYLDPDKKDGDKNKNLTQLFSIIPSEVLEELKKAGCFEDGDDQVPENDRLFVDYSMLDQDVEEILDDAYDLTINHFNERKLVVDTDVVFLCTLMNLEVPLPEEVQKIILGGKSVKTTSTDIPEVLGSDMQAKIEEALRQAMKEPESDDDDEFEKYGGDRTPLNAQEVDPNSEVPTLEQFSTNMIKESAKYDPVIGRDKEVDSIIEILCKRKKANPVLVGEAGCGKSAIIELLASRIASGSVPAKLKGKVIYALNLNDLVAGTKYRGEYEERLQRIIREVCSHPNIIIYIDELHNLVGNGSSSGNGDAANILKPYLARGEFQCIGSTTQTEYRRFIESDAALNRRFTQVEVTIPTAEETVKILMGIKDSYEKYHHVRIGKDIIEACVEWSGRYVSDKNFPDKAIDILDLSSSVVGLREVVTENTELKKKLEDIIEQKIKAVRVDNDFELGEQLREEELKVKAELAAEQKAKDAAAKNRKNWTEVKLEDVAYSVSRVSRVPVDKINQSDASMLAKMKASLQKKVIGQDKAVEILTQAIQRNYLGLRDPKKPIASILAVGPSGVGKTLICSELASIFFGNPDRLIRIDGGMLKEAGSINTLLGAPPSFVGHDKEPLLLQVKRKPQCVLLIDEVEKMHSSIFDIFLNIMEEGTATLNTGDTIDFRNCILIMTGNIGTKEIKQFGNGIGFGGIDKGKENEAIVKKAIEKTFKVEFLNRLSSIIVFNELGQAELLKIFTLEFDKVKKQLSKKKYSVSVTKALKDYIVSKCDRSFGARDLKRYISQYIVDKVSAKMLETPDQTKYQVDVVDGEVVVK